jgi:hypothetical protein
VDAFHQASVAPLVMVMVAPVVMMVARSMMGAPALVRTIAPTVLAMAPGLMMTESGGRSDHLDDPENGSAFEQRRIHFLSLTYRA